MGHVLQPENYLMVHIFCSGSPSQETNGALGKQPEAQQTFYCEIIMASKANKEPLIHVIDCRSLTFLYFCGRNFCQVYLPRNLMVQCLEQIFSPEQHSV